MHEEIQKKYQILVSPKLWTQKTHYLYCIHLVQRDNQKVFTYIRYLVYASYTHKVVFDYQANDIYWCTADIGWITGHSYVVYGPLVMVQPH